MTLPLQRPLALTARDIYSQERNHPASPPWAFQQLGHLTKYSLGTLLSILVIRYGICTMCTPDVAPRKGRYVRHSPAIPRGQQWQLPVQSAGAPCALPFMPTMEQLDTVTHNLHFRAGHPHLQLHSSYSTCLMPGTQRQHCSSPRLKVQHPNMPFCSSQFQCQACLTGCQPCLCVPGT